MKESHKYLLHTFGLLLFMVSTGWLIQYLGYPIFSTPCVLLAASYLLIIHWKDRAARLITFIYVFATCVNLLGTWITYQDFYLFLIFGIFFDLAARWIYLHYDVVARWFNYPLPTGSNFFQVFAISRIFIVSIFYNALLLISIIPYLYFDIDAPAEFLHNWQDPFKLFLSLLIYLNIWSLLFDSNSLQKLRKLKAKAA
ncbi:hypothetical protein [Algicola sagamiensis]|uniref:hypothetical protein n=1 Tax=Algicola sagamiensis TaxID=163869 RepID=UPI000375E7C3|nr:hypothetical protein [Algicola sagamiensis]